MLVHAGAVCDPTASAHQKFYTLELEHLQASLSGGNVKGKSTTNKCKMKTKAQVCLASSKSSVIA